MGNICRSPLAKAVLRARAAAASLDATVDSAGTHRYHIGEPADPRAIEAARLRGYDLSEHRARQVVSEDFFNYDFLLAMDHANLRRLRKIAPAGHDAELALLLQFAPDLSLMEVPDPYYGGAQGFEKVLDLVEAAVDGFLGHLHSSAWS